MRFGGSQGLLGKVGWEGLMNEVAEQATDDARRRPWARPALTRLDTTRTTGSGTNNQEGDSSNS